MFEEMSGRAVGRRWRWLCGKGAASRWGGGWMDGGVGGEMLLRVGWCCHRNFHSSSSYFLVSEGPQGFTKLTSMRVEAVREWGEGSGSGRCRGSIEAGRGGDGGDACYGRGMHHTNVCGAPLTLTRSTMRSYPTQKN